MNIQWLHPRETVDENKTATLIKHTLNRAHVWGEVQCLSLEAALESAEAFGVHPGHSALWPSDIFAWVNSRLVKVALVN